MYGIGYIGIGEHKPYINGVCTKEYVVWRNMLRRRYDKEHQKVYKTYKGCTVAREWHNFQNFAEWYNKEYYDIEESLEVDKDFKIKGNSVYKDKNCLITSIESIKVTNILMINNGHNVCLPLLNSRGGQQEIHNYIKL